MKRFKPVVNLFFIFYCKNMILKLR